MEIKLNVIYMEMVLFIAIAQILIHTLTFSQLKGINKHFQDLFDLENCMLFVIRKL